ncbi:MAG: histidine kinase [Lachnospiraceae bacterium]|jgi:two-component system sensor histidine kinase YesM|nr:histidine kinase [Lachnospiraceae bacterium]
MNSVKSSKKRACHWIKRQTARLGEGSIRYSIFIYFTITALVAIIIIGFSLYTRFSDQLTDEVQKENQILMNQVSRSVDSYLRGMMKLSDAIYYSVVKNTDISEPSIGSQMKLLYDSNVDSLENIALFSREGELLKAVPAARLKTDLDVTQEEWFQETLKKTENLHFSLPHVQYIFDNAEGQYHWVISVSRAVEITQGAYVSQGVLLLDIRYSSLEQLLNSVALGNAGYIYLIGDDGKLIYHPKNQLIDSGRVQENHRETVNWRDGIHEEIFQGEKRFVTVKTVGYTGWKLVGITPAKGISFSGVKTRLFIVFVILLILFLLVLINYYISSRITNPIHELENSVGELEDGNLEAEISIKGSYEIQHLGRSITSMAQQIQVLMKDIVAEHESKRKSEFDTLQSQINPHFLYNTLDIIVWMIENEQKSEAVKVVTALARFFRISLSRGKSIIRVSDELEHVRNYLMIQHMRFKNKFTYQIQADDDVLEMASLKLMLQPLVENAIYHGMEFMDGDGEILIRASKKGDELLFSIEDNGLGMCPEQVERLLTDTSHVPSRRGSGIGVRNVNERIRLYFGEDYGLEIDSEPDEGTRIYIHLPVVFYDELTAEEMKKRGGGKKGDES